MLMRNISCLCIKQMPGMSLLVDCVCHARGEREMRSGLTMRQFQIEDGCSQLKRIFGGTPIAVGGKVGGEVISLAAA